MQLMMVKIPTTLPELRHLVTMMLRTMMLRTMMLRTMMLRTMMLRRMMLRRMMLPMLRKRKSRRMCRRKIRLSWPETGRNGVVTRSVITCRSVRGSRLNGKSVSLIARRGPGIPVLQKISNGLLGLVARLMAIL